MSFMIQDEIKRIREAENDALLRMERAEKESKEKVEIAKKEIRKRIETEREELLKKIDEWKDEAEKQGKIEAEKILAEYQKNVKDIEKIEASTIREVASEVLKEILR